MEAEDVISLVKSIKEQKEQKVKLKGIQIKKKEKEDSTAVKANASAKKTDALLLDKRNVHHVTQFYGPCVAKLAVKQMARNQKCYSQ